MSQRKKGTVKWFSSEKGYGFITQTDGTDIFVHFREIEGEGYRTLNEGQAVEYTVGEGKKGPAAQQVTVL